MNVDHKVAALLHHSDDDTPVIDLFTGLHGAAAQSVSPHFMVALSDNGNMVRQLYAIYGLVGVSEDQTVTRFGVSVFAHGP